MPSGNGFKSLGKARRPSSGGESSMSRRFLHPAERQEIDARVSAYRRQFEKQGCFTYLPGRGSGQSASDVPGVEASAMDECAAEADEECLRVLPGA